MEMIDYLETDVTTWHCQSTGSSKFEECPEQNRTKFELILCTKSYSKETRKTYDRSKISIRQYQSKSFKK